MAHRTSKGLLAASASSLALVAAAAVAPSALAQQAVTGQVKGPDGEINIAGASVRIEELGVETTTGTDGRFRFPSVPAGQYTLTADFLGGGETQELFTVLQDGPVNLQIQLATSGVDRIIVSGTRGALASARAQERAADQLRTVVTSDDIGQFADQNIAESLQRLPGLSINRSEGEGRQAAIRGLGGSFVTVTVDGVKIGARDTETRSVDLDVLSSDLLNGISVSKTLTPDQDADAIAGSIDLRTLSAFDRGENSLSFRGEYGFQEKSEDFNPKVSGDFTRLFDLSGGGRLGVAGGVSWQRRESLVDELSHDDGLIVFSEGDRVDLDDLQDDLGDEEGLAAYKDILASPDTIYLPARINLRSDPAERTRLSGNLNLEYRPNDDLELFVRGTYARFTDDDIRNRQRVRLDRSTGDEILALSVDDGVVSGSFEDSRSEMRFRFADQEDNLYTISSGGEFTRDGWTASAQLDYSKNDSEIIQTEPRFRVDNFQVDFDNLTDSSFEFVVGPEEGGDADEDPTNPENFAFRFVTTYDFFVEDEIVAARGDLQRDFSGFNGRPAFIKVGAKYQDRSKVVDVERANVFADGDFSLADFTLGDPIDGTDIIRSFDPSLDELEAFGLEVRATGTPEPGFVISSARDFDTSEEVLSGYLMADFELTDTLKMFGGLRIEHTTWDTTGFFADTLSYSDEVTTTLYAALSGAGVSDAELLASSLGPRFVVNDDGTIDPTGAVDEVSVLIDASGENEYTDYLPNFNVRWEPVEDIVVRASYTEGVQRPDFEEAAANSEFVTSEVTGQEVEDEELAAVTTIAQAEALVVFDRLLGTRADPLRDPELDPLRARQYDMSVSWYPNPDTFLQAAVFYKDIRDFIFELGGVEDPEDLAEFGIDVDRIRAESNVPLRDVEFTTFTNGDAAEVYGLELTYAQAYTFLPAPFNGLFSYANVTFADSEANERFVDRTFTLPEQADVVGNISLGYENDRFTVRWSGNYVGER
ncbi:MAG: TonB-dependent receptor, partial [Caulobacterales bacterium]|nr:TonB-dependent receptor [Caulobacterales bacterium]